MAIGFWMNNKNCYGCKTCSIACKSEKQLDRGVLLRTVTEIRQDDPAVGNAASSRVIGMDEDVRLGVARPSTWWAPTTSPTGTASSSPPPRRPSSGWPLGRKRASTPSPTSSMAFFSFSSSRVMPVGSMTLLIRVSMGTSKASPKP